jgi:hypothetical protein
MCFCVVEVRYRNKTEPDQLIPLADEDSANARIEQLKGLETVDRIRVFVPGTTHQRVSSWDMSSEPKKYEFSPV